MESLIASSSVEMSVSARVLLIALCLLTPAAWGLTVEWLFHRLRVNGRGNGTVPQAEPYIQDWVI